MKSIVCVNAEIPTVEAEHDFSSQGSLRDYDIVVFRPLLPYSSRIDFTGGGSCISIEGTASIKRSISHWRGELGDALAAGKTIFVILDSKREDQGAIGSTMTAKNSRNYTTEIITSYDSIPASIALKNARGSAVHVKDAMFRGFFEAVQDILEYRVVIDASMPAKAAFVAKDGATIGGIVRFQNWTGTLVLLPYFDFQGEGFTDDADENDEEYDEIWTEKALRVSRDLVAQLIAIDKFLRSSGNATPPPIWVADQARPRAVIEAMAAIERSDAQIREVTERRATELEELASVSSYSHLLYESGKALEEAVERALILLGYQVESLRIGHLEIDHIIIGPSGQRMIGETEGKDSSAVDISKFRQLESNIGEDFDRDDVLEPAKGVLFGNGFRLTQPDKRPIQFTPKCLKNASRVGSALVKTADLYDVVVHLLDNPEDEQFRAACRFALENEVGGVVVFPKPDAQLSSPPAK